MKTYILTTLLALAALPAFAAEPFVTHNGTGYVQAFKDENKALKLWEYVPEGQKVENWKQMFTVHQYQTGIKAAELAERVAAFNQQQKSLLMFDKPTNAVCFVVRNDKVIEANAWRYADKDGKSWGNALQYRFPVDTKNGLKDEIGPGSPFAKTCEDMKSWTMKYPS